MGKWAAPIPRWALPKWAGPVLWLFLACFLGCVVSGCGGATGPNFDSPLPAPPPGNPLATPSKVIVENPSGSPRRETVLASFPIAEGELYDVTGLSVLDVPTAFRVLQRWRDGSLRMVQAQFVTDLDAFETKTFELRRDTRFWRVYLKNPNNTGIGRDFLTGRVYLTEFRDMPIAYVDYVLGNDYQGADEPKDTSDPNLFPLGPVSFRTAELSIGGCKSALVDQARFGVSAPSVADGLETWKLLENTWLDDGQTLVWRFVLRFDNPSASGAEREAWESVQTSIVEHPLRPLATRASWQETGGLGLCGGPVSGPLDSKDRAERSVHKYANNEWGPFGTWGEVKYTHTTGTPRNAPCSVELAHAIQGEVPALLEALEGKARRQALRTYHLWNLRVGNGKEIYMWEGLPYRRGSQRISNETLGRKKLWDSDPYVAWRTNVNWGFQDHGWNAFDEEHFSTDLLFDYWTVTGNEWAKDELTMLGQCLKALMRLEYYYTSNVQSARAEGWTMQSFVQCYLATGDEDLKDYAISRINQVIEPQRFKTHPSKALSRQWNYPATQFPNPTSFFMPWQHAAVIYGYLGAWRFFGSQNALQIAEDVVTTVDYSVVYNYNDPKFGLIPYGLRYYVPMTHNNVNVPANYFDSLVGPKWGDGPTVGVHKFLVGGLFLLAELTKSSTVRDHALFHARKLLGPVDSNRSQLWEKWMFTIRDQDL